MNKNIIGALVIVVAFLAFAIFESNNDGTVSPQKPEVTLPNPSTKTNHIRDGAWPPPPEDGSILMETDPVLTNYYVIFDASGSMKEYVSSNLPKLEAGKQALVTFANNVPENANLGLLSFDPVNELLPLGRGNREAFVRAVENISANGRTPLVQSILTGYEVLTKQAQKQSGYGRYIMLIVTDGASSDGDPAGIALEVTGESPIEVQTIGFGLTNHALNIPGVTQYVTASSPQALIDALNQVIASESEQFVDPDSLWEKEG